MGSAIGALSADHWGRRRTILVASVLAVAAGAVYLFVADPALVMVCAWRSSSRSTS